MPLLPLLLKNKRYLRFYAASASGITGDRHFRFSGLFPEALRPALDIVSAAVWLAMVRSELIKYFRDIDLEMAEADEQVFNRTL